MVSFDRINSVSFRKGEGYYRPPSDKMSTGSLGSLYSLLKETSEPEKRRDIARRIVNRESEIIHNSVYEIKTYEDYLSSVIHARAAFDTIVKTIGYNDWPGFTAATKILESNYRSLFPYMHKNGVYIEKLWHGFGNVFAPVADRGWKFRSTSKDIIEKMFILKHVHTTPKDEWGWYSELHEIVSERSKL